jgi:hypothetical protein
MELFFCPIVLGGWVERELAGAGILLLGQSRQSVSNRGATLGRKAFFSGRRVFKAESGFLWAGWLGGA